MKKLLLSIIGAMAIASAHAAPVNVTFSFGSIATGGFTYDSSADGGVIGYSDLSSFSLQFAGASTSFYDLAFLNSGNDSVWNYMAFNSATDTFVSTNISGFHTTLADIKNSFNAGFFIRDDLSLIADYAGGGSQTYSSFTINVDRNNDVPEPSSLALLGLGLVGLAAMRRRKI